MADRKPGEAPFRCDQNQYRCLLRCSKKRDMTEWNEWRFENPDVEVWLEGKPMGSAQLAGSPLEGASFQGKYLRGIDLAKAHLRGAHFFQADLKDANLMFADLRHADLRNARLDGVKLAGVHMEHADARGIHLPDAELQGIQPYASHLEHCALAGANLQGANFWGVHLEGADLSQADVRGATFRQVAVDASTSFWGRRFKVDRATDFAGVDLATARVPTGIRQLLECNVRRLAWKGWFRTTSITAWDAKLAECEGGNRRPPLWLRFVRGVVEYFKRLVMQSFWFLSDYGRLTWRIMGFFFLFAAYFGLAYWLYPYCLIVNGEVGALTNFWHALYFSIITQTTVGFGDLHANPTSQYGQLLLMLQVILGYVLLGALVTRFAVLFTAAGPTRRFSPKRDRQSGKGPEFCEHLRSDV